MDELTGRCTENVSFIEESEFDEVCSEMQTINQMNRLSNAHQDEQASSGRAPKSEKIRLRHADHAGMLDHALGYSTQNLHNPHNREYNHNHSNENSNETTHDEMDSNEGEDSDVLSDEKDWELLSRSAGPFEGLDELCEATGDASKGEASALSSTQIMLGEQYAVTGELAVRECGIQREHIAEIARGFAVTRDLPCHSNGAASDGQRRTSGALRTSESNELNGSNEEANGQWSGGESSEDQVHGSPSSFLLNEFESILRWVPFSAKMLC